MNRQNPEGVNRTAERKGEIIMEFNMEVTLDQFGGLLRTGRNIAIFGNMGQGKTKKVRDYAKETGKHLLVISLAMEMPEAIGGIPYARTDAETKASYFKKLLDQRLTPVIECQGKDWILFFDEGNQGTAEVLNTLFGIAHPDPEERNWAGYPIPYAQVILAGNLSDGTDKTVYITELPGPLLDRFYVVKLLPSMQGATDYLREKYKNIPQVHKYIRAMLEGGANPRTTEQALKDMVDFGDDPILAILLGCKLGEALSRQVLDLRENIRSVDPEALITQAKLVYKRLLERGEVRCGLEMVTSVEELKRKFAEYLSEEEIEAVMKGEE